MSFIKPLTDAMRQTDPELRPTAAQALEQFHSIMAKQSDISQRWRLRGKDEYLIASLYRDISLSFGEALRYGKKVFERATQ